MNSIHPTAVIGDGVVLGDSNVIGPHVVLYGPLEIGDGNWIGPGVTIGTPPEVRGVDHGVQWESIGSARGIVIGHRNVIREQTLIHQGWQQATVLGDDCFLMNKVYVAHDTMIESGSTLASTVTMGGHVRIGAGATVGLGTVVHQRRFVAAGAMVGMGSVVTRDVPPFALAFGTPARVRGANRVGMTRRGLEASAVDALSALYERGVVPTADDVPDVLRDEFLTWEKVSAP